MVKSWCCYLSLVGGCFNSSEEYDRQIWIHLPHIFRVKIKDVWSFTTQIKNDSSKIKNEIFNWYHVPPLEDGSVPKHDEIISSIKGWFQIKPLETRFNWCFVFQSRKKRDIRLRSCGISEFSEVFFCWFVRCRPLDLLFCCGFLAEYKYGFFIAMRFMLRLDSKFSSALRQWCLLWM